MELKHLRNKFNFWFVHGIMNTSGLFAREPKYSLFHEQIISKQTMLLDGVDVGRPLWRVCGVALIGRFMKV